MQNINEDRGEDSRKDAVCVDDTTTIHQYIKLSEFVSKYHNADYYNEISTKIRGKVSLL